MRSRLRLGASRILFASLFCGPFLVLCVFDSPIAFAGIKRALENLADAMEKAGDEATKGTASLLKAVAKQSDESLEAIGGALKAESSSVDEVVDVLRRAGVQDVDSLRVTLGEMDSRQLGIIKELVETSRHVVERADSLGRGIDEVVSVASHPEGVAALRMMKTDEGFQAVLDGQKRFGEAFIDFARKADEPGVIEASKYFDELEELKKTAPDKFNDFMQNPTKYLDQKGRPTKAFDDLLAPVRKPSVGKNAVGKRDLPKVITVVTGIGAWIASGVASLTKRIIAAFPSLAPFADKLSTGLYGLLVIVFLLLLWGIKFVWRFIVFLISLIPGEFGAEVRHARDSRKQKAERAVRFRPRRVERQTLYIGLLGIERVGKTTFIGILYKYLHNLVKGASLRPHDEGSAESLDQILQEIKTCQPTKTNSDVVLDLTWPFSWKSAENDARQRDEREAEQPSPDYSNKMELQLRLQDYPGEWARDDHTDRIGQKRKELIEKLRPTDALIVVIDPSNLEASNNQDRAQDQWRAIDAMFRSDGLGLGDGFRRTLCILITKRDTLDRATLENLASSKGAPLGDEFEKAVKLATKRVLSAEESRELGKWIFQRMFPDSWETIESRLYIQGRNRFHCLPFPVPFGLFSVPTKPKVAVFAVSQLGTRLGDLVSRYREEVKTWERNGRNGPKPTTELPLDQMESAEVEVHHPFRWILDNIPSGWLHELAGYPYWSRVRTFWKIRRRFSGSPEIQKVVRAFGLFAVVSLLALLILVPLIVYGVQKWSQYTGARLTIELAATYIEQDKIDELGNRLALWKSFATKPFEKERLFLENLVEVAKNRPKGDDISGEEAREWLQSFAEIKVHNDLDDHLKNALESLREKANRVIDKLKREAIGEAENASGKDLRARVAPLDKAISLFKDLPFPPEKELGELQLKRDAIITEDVQREWEDRRDRAGTLARNRQFKEAIAVLDEIRWSDLLSEEKRNNFEEKRKRERKRILSDFWDDTKLTAEAKAKEGELSEALGLIRNFKGIKDNEYREEAERFEKDLPALAFDSTLEKAEQEMDKGTEEGIQKAYELLEDIRGEKNVKPESRIRWYRLMGKVLELKGSYRDLVKHWKSDGDFNDFPKEERVERLQHAYSRLLDQYRQDIKQAQECDPQIAGDQDDQGSNPCQKALAQLKRIQVFLEEMNRVDYYELSDKDKEVLKQSLREDFQAQIEVTLRWLETDYQKGKPELERTVVPALKGLTANPDRPALVERTLRRIVAAAEVGFDFESAARFIDVLRQELNIPLDADWEKRQAELWRKAAQHIWKTWRDGFLDTTQSGGEWRKWLDELRKELNTGDKPQLYRDELLRLSDEFVQQFVKETKSRINEYLAKEDFKNAEAELRRLEDVAGWLGRHYSWIESDVNGIRQNVSNAKFDSELKQLRVDGDKCANSVEREKWMKRWTALKEGTTSDDQRSKCEKCRNDIVKGWEQKDADKLEKVWRDSDYQRAGELAEQYLELEKWCNSLSRKADAQKVLEWLNQFKGVKQYTIDAIEFQGIPYSRLLFINPRFDIACRLIVNSGNEKEKKVVDTRAESVYGTGTLTKFKDDQEVHWSPGQEVQLEIWDDEVGKKGHYVGKIQEKSAYSLIKLGTQFITITDEGTDYTRYNWNSCRFKLVLQLDGKQVKKPEDLFSSGH